MNHPPATVGQNIVIPSLELVGAANGVQHGLSRLQSQMICIVQTQSTAGLLELFGRETLEGRLGRHRHENWEFNWPMREMEGRGTSLGGLERGRGFVNCGSRRRGRAGGVVPYRASRVEVKGQGRGFRSRRHAGDWSECIGPDASVWPCGGEDVRSWFGYPEGQLHAKSAREMHPPAGRAGMYFYTSAFPLVVLGEAVSSICAEYSGGVKGGRHEPLC